MRKLSSILMAGLIATLSIGLVGCEDGLEFDDGSDAGWYDEYDYDGGSDSGTFFSDYGGSLSYW